MIKETDGDHFEEMRSLEQELTFQTTAEEFAERKLAFGPLQMRSLGITSQDGIHTNLGLLLSDQCVHTIKAAVFEGTTQNEFKDRKEFTGSLLKQMNDVYEYIDFRNPVHSTFDKLRRIDQRSIPEVAVREALLNLLIHREYAFRASALISLYSDRIEFVSVGGLVSGVTLNDVMMGISVCRNMNLANVFYRLELIEAYGTGIRKIMEAYEGTNLTPQIEASDNVFKITLPSLTAPREEKPLTYTSGSEKDKEEKLILSLQRQGTIRRKDAESLLGESQSSCGRLLKKLTGSGKIVREGNGKNTFYRLP
ncbi:MAG: AAA family ATPase [Lachnospiraceae bacterium]|nr:AAA family ATPase [Lachnospiraceae bacterium]